MKQTTTTTTKILAKLLAMTETKQQNCNNIENGHSTITSIERSRKDENESSEGPTVNLPNSVLNKLFTTFYVNQRREALKWFLSAYLCFSIYTLAIPADQAIQNRSKYNFYICITKKYIS